MATIFSGERNLCMRQGVSLTEGMANLLQIHPIFSGERNLCMRQGASLIEGMAGGERNR